MSGQGTTSDPDGSEPVTVFVLDDHELVRRGIRDVLESAGGIRVVGESGSAVDAVARIPVLRPDVALVDGRLPDGSGVEVCRQLSQRAPAVATVVLTSYDDVEQLFAAILAGASGYLLKQVSSTDLVEAVRRLAAGESLLDPSLTPQVLARIRADTGPPDPSPTLTVTEERILSLLGDGLSNRQIAQRTGLAEKTVKNYVSLMLGKLGLESRTQAAILALRRRSSSESGQGPDC
jgi:two-component system, NarL family, response regulator DevR